MFPYNTFHGSTEGTQDSGPTVESRGTTDINYRRNLLKKHLLEADKSILTQRFKNTSQYLDPKWVEYYVIDILFNESTITVSVWVVSTEVPTALFYLGAAGMVRRIIFRISKRIRNN